MSVMQSRRAILVDGSRLTRELVKRVIERNAGFEVVKELGDVREIPAAVTETNVEWVFVTLASNQEIPEHLKAELFLRHPTLRIVGLWVDGGHVNVEWLGRQHKDLTGLTFDELTHLLRDELQTLQEVNDDGVGRERQNGSLEKH
jgi:hypothetical protein